MVAPALIQLIGSLIIAIYLVQLIKGFSYMSLSELRRRAKAGQTKAKAVLKARSHGLRLWAILWTALCVTLILIVVSVDSLLSSFWLSLLLNIILLTCILFVLPWSKQPQPNLSWAAAASPWLGFILNHLRSVFNLFAPLKLSQRIRSDLPTHIHSKENLLEIIQGLQDTVQDQRAQADLALTISSLALSSEKIKTACKPLSEIKTLTLSQKLSPKLLNSLHSSKQAVFPVSRPGKKNDFIGVVLLGDATNNLSKGGVAVKEITRDGVYYIHQRSTLKELFQAFLVTEQQLFLVVNSKQKVKGVITLRDVLKRYLKEQPRSEFKNYDDLKQVSEQYKITDVNKN